MELIAFANFYMARVSKAQTLHEIIIAWVEAGILTFLLADIVCIKSEK